MTFEKATSPLQILVVVALLISTVLPAPTTAHHYGRVLLMGKWTLIFDDQRLIFNAGMIAGNFFDELEPRQTAEGAYIRHFGRHSERVTDYPQALVVDVFASPWDSRETPFDKRCAGNAAALMDNLKFKAEWKTGLKMIPVSRMTARRLQKNEMAPITRWGYELSISAERVPLTDHLIVSVYGPDSNLIVRFSAAP